MYSELYHHGILGQKWGMRRYQNKDGSLTPEGKVRYSDNISKNSNHHTSRISKTKTILQESSNINTKLMNIEKNTRSKEKLDLSNMSDSELKNKVNRLKLERQYINMLESEKEISSGHDFVRRALSVAGDTLAISGSVLTIALAVKEFRG